MKVLKVLILLLLVKISYGQTYKTFVKSFNVDDYNEIICDLPGDVKIEIWDKPNCQILLGVKLKTKKESIIDYLSRNNRYDILILEDLIETHISLPNVKNVIIVNGVELSEEFLTIIKVPKTVLFSDRKQILVQ